MSHAFTVKLLTSKLFGIVEVDNQEPWWDAFAKSPTQVVQFDGAVLDAIAEDLGIDFEGQASSVSRYVTGAHRTGTRGLGTSELGTFGEVIAYLHCRAQQYDVQRVLRSVRPDGVIEGRFPTPDFLVRRDGDLEAWEVKTTEALDHHACLNVNRRKFLKPCVAIEAGRDAALEQLGYIEGVLAPQAHQLQVAAEKIVPFPVARGTAVAVALRDGRINKLRSDKRLLTPPACRAQKRDCWECLPEPVDAVMAVLHNAPGRLSLANSERRPPGWFTAYRRWTQSLQSFDQRTVDHAADELVFATAQWLAAEDRAQPRLRGFWGSHIEAVYGMYGLEVGEVLTRNGLSEREDGWTPPPRAAPPLQIGADVSFRRRRVQGSHRFVLDGPGREGRYSVETDQRSWRLRMLSRAWVQGSELSDETAQIAASDLIAEAVRLTGTSAPDRYRVPMRRIVSRAFESSSHLGWTVANLIPDEGGWLVTPELAHWRDLLASAPAWLSSLAIGDPRVSLTVFPDGRGHLRIDRGLIETEG